MTKKCDFCNRESKFICDGKTFKLGAGIVPCNKEVCQFHTAQTKIHVNKLFGRNKWITHDLCPDCSDQ